MDPWHLLDAFKPVPRLSFRVRDGNDDEPIIDNGRHDVERKALDGDPSHGFRERRARESSPGIRKLLDVLHGRFKSIEEDQAKAVALLVVPFASQVELTLGLAKESEGPNQGLYSARTR